MKRYVALATDANPHYSVYAPIVVRLWRHLGWQSILMRHDTGWDTPLGELVLAELARDGDGVVTNLVPRCEPLSVGNTMRVSRLAAAATPGVNLNDVIMTADIDMAPLSRTWFNLWQAPAVLRADMYGSLRGASGLSYEGKPALICGLFRFPLCYVMLHAETWYDILPLVADDVVFSLRRVLHGLRHDQVDYDEATCSARLLLHRDACGSLEFDGHPRSDEIIMQNKLTLACMTDWPTGVPQRMLIHGQANPDGGRVRWPDPIDFHMPRPCADWIGRAIAKYWLEEADWVIKYWERAYPLTRGR